MIFNHGHNQKLFGCTGEFGGWLYGFGGLDLGVEFGGFNLRGWI